MSSLRLEDFRSDSGTLEYSGRKSLPQRPDRGTPEYSGRKSLSQRPERGTPEY
jgi:hypothetical protein